MNLLTYAYPSVSLHAFTRPYQLLHLCTSVSSRISTRLPATLHVFPHLYASSHISTHLPAFLRVFPHFYASSRNSTRLHAILRVFPHLYASSRISTRLPASLRVFLRLYASLCIHLHELHPCTPPRLSGSLRISVCPAPPCCTRVTSLRVFPHLYASLLH